MIRRENRAAPRISIVAALRLAALALSAMAMAGCVTPPQDAKAPSPEPAVPTFNGRPMMPVSATTRPSAKNVLLLVRLRMTTIEVPVGTASGSEELWSYLDEESTVTMHPASLGANGLRVGVGKHSSWDDIVKALNRMTGRTAVVNMSLAVPGQPIPITLKKPQATQTIFTFYSDRTVSGQDYPPGEDTLTITCTLNSDDPSVVMITGLPQVRDNRQYTQFVRQGPGMTMVARSDVHSFDPLTFRLSVPSRDYVVFGPSLEARRPNSVGHNFLIRQKEGVDFETVVIMMPEVFAIAAPGEETSEEGK